jgi:hypothetical protein
MVMKSTRRTRVLPLATLVATALAAAALAGPAVGADSAVPPCSSAQLSLRFVGMSAATGHRFIDYAFKNTGARKCSLRGYPSAALLNKQGSVIHSSQAKVHRWPLSKVRTVVIAPGKRAFFSFTWVDGAFCPGNSFTFYSLRVFPPKNAKSFRWHLGTTPTCSGSAMVSAVRPKVFPF